MAEKVLKNLRIPLRDRLSEAVIKDLVDDLQDENVLHGEEIEHIKHRNKLRTDQARALIDGVMMKGRKASEILFEYLKLRDNCLYEDLEIDCLLAMEPTPSHLPAMPGCTSDSLKTLFKHLGFEVEIKKDKTADEIKTLMVNYSMDHRQRDCFVCCVMSHGTETGVEGYDEQICPLNDITCPFDGDNCKCLKDKPKVFFIQACRGYGIQKKVLVADGGVASTPKSGKVSYSIAHDSDFLIAMSTVEGYRSFRDTQSGSWFIQSLCHHIKEGSKRGQDILSILTKVNDDVSRMEGIVIINDNEVDAKMTPQPFFTLRKLLIFRAP